MVDAFVCLQRKLVLTLMWINVLMPSARLFTIALEYAYDIPLDLFDVVFHIVVTPLNYSVAWMHFKGGLSLQTMGVVYVEIDSIVFVHLGFVADRHISLIWVMGSLYTTFFVESPMIDNRSKIKALLFIKPLLLIFGAGLLSGDIKILQFKDIFALASIFNFGLFGTYFYLMQENRSLAILIELKEAHQKLADIVEAVPFGVFVFTSEHKISIANASCLQILKCSESDEILLKLKDCAYIEGRRFYPTRLDSSELIEDIDHFLEYADDGNATFGSTGEEGSIVTWQGKRVLWGDQMAIIVVLKDVTQLIELERSQAESKFKSLLLRSVSHEIRSPITAVIHAVRGITEVEGLPSEVISKLTIADISCKHILALINDLLDYSQIIAGKFNLARSHFNLRNLLSDCFELMKLIAEKKQLQFVFQLDPFLPEQIRSDPNRLTQVIINLLSNAIKFTPRKGRIALMATYNDDGSLGISVKDSGIGIAPENIKSLFKMFGRIENGDSINPQGIGLGLNISNMLAIELGSAEIQVESKLNEGSCFSFKVALENPNPFFLIDCSEPSDEGNIDEMAWSKHQVYEFDFSGFNCPQVLVVDDSPFNRAVIVEILSSQHISCSEADTGKSALEFIQNKAKHGVTVQVIITDIEMPELDGPSATKAIIEWLSSSTLKVPSIIGHSGNFDPSTVALCKEAGMIDFIPKPSSKDFILSTVKRYL